MSVHQSLHRANCWFRASAGLEAAHHAHTDALDYDLCLSNTRVTSPSDLDPAFKAANTWSSRTPIVTLQQSAEPVSCSNPAHVYRDKAHIYGYTALEAASNLGQLMLPSCHQIIQAYKSSTTSVSACNIDYNNTLGHFWLSAPYTTMVLTGAFTPSNDLVAYTKFVQVHALSTSPT